MKCFSLFPGVRIPRQRNAFTLIELLVVVSIIALLMGVLLPVLSTARESGQATQCYANLHSQGTAMASYQHDFKEYFPPYARGGGRPSDPVGPSRYFWGMAIDTPGPDEGKVDRSASWLVSYASTVKELFICPSMTWGNYIPEGSAPALVEPSSCYGYNGYFFDSSGSWWTTDANNNPFPLKRIRDISDPAQLFAFGDAAQDWPWGPVTGLKASSLLDPPQVEVYYGGALTAYSNTTPTNHFRHRGVTQVLMVDGHAQKFARPASVVDTEKNLGFVSELNSPYYVQ